MHIKFVFFKHLYFLHAEVEETIKHSLANMLGAGADPEIWKGGGDTSQISLSK